MGIKHLRMILNNNCTNISIRHFPTVNNFIISEKMRMYKETSMIIHKNNPFKQIQLKKLIDDQPYLIGIDTYLYASRYKRVFKKIEYGFFRQIMESLSSKMIPLYVFDGIAPVLKRKTINKRQFKKQKNRNKLEKILTTTFEINDANEINDIDNIDEINEANCYNENNMENLNFDQLVEHINQLKNKLMDNVSPASAEKEYLISVFLNGNDAYDDTWSNRLDNKLYDELGNELDFQSDNNFANKLIMSKEQSCLQNNSSSGYLLYDKSESNSNQELIKLAKKSIGIEYDDIKKLKKFLDLLKIPYITAKGEADDMMALLYKKGIINACQSDDMDMLPKGCGNLIQISNTGVSQYLLNEILIELDLTYEQFVDLCILLGSDYHTTYLPKIKPLELFGLFKQYPSLEQFVENYLSTDPKIIGQLESYKEIRNLFLIVTEELDKDIFFDKLVPFNFNNIKCYLSSIGINLNNFHDKKFRAMIQYINAFIITLSTKR